MSTSVHLDVLIGGPLVIKNSANILHLVPASAGAGFSETTAASIWSAAMVSADYVLGVSGLNCTLTAATKTSNATGASAAGIAKEWRYCDAVSGKVLWTTNETGSAAVVSGNSYRSPALVYTSRQLEPV
jgi:hypothetical protein